MNRDFYPPWPISEERLTTDRKPDKAALGPLGDGVDDLGRGHEGQTHADRACERLPDRRQHILINFASPEYSAGLGYFAAELRSRNRDHRQRWLSLRLASKGGK
jgi:hypothetical protein